MNDKPPFRTFYGKNSKWLLAFIIGGNLLSFILFKTWDSWDITAFRFTFWMGTGIFIVSLVGSLIHYRNTFYQDYKNRKR